MSETPANAPDATVPGAGPEVEPATVVEPDEPSGPSATDDPKERSLGYYIGVALSAVLLIIIVALALLLIIVPKVSGSIPLTVLTSSMEPSLPPGTLIIVKPIDPEDIVVGDVVTYQIESGVPGVITHRVIDVVISSTGDRTFIFQGDNNGSPDDLPVLPVQIQGKVWYSIPYMGFVNSTVNGSNRTWIIPVIAGALFVYSTYMIISGIYSANRTRKHNAARKAAGLPPLTKDERKQRAGRKVDKRR